MSVESTRSRAALWAALATTLCLLPGTAARGIDPPPSSPGTRDSAPLPTGRLPTPDVRETYVREPIFGGEVYLYETGLTHTESVFLVHGLGEEGARVWDRLIPELADRYHVVAFDLPGFGRSEKRNELYSPARYAAFLGWVVERYRKGPFDVVGHSLGGAVALLYAADDPPGLERLVLADVAGVLHRSILTRLAVGTALERTAPGLAGKPLEVLQKLAVKTIDRVQHLLLDVDEVLGSPTYRETMLGGDPGLIASFALAQQDFGPAIDRVRAPCLLLWGSEDDVASLRTGRLLRFRLPRARLELIPGAGHTPPAEQPEAFNRKVLDALSSPPRPAEARSEQTPGDRTVRWSGVVGDRLTGAYGRIEITDCRDIRLQDVVAESVEITRSQVEMEDCRIGGDGTGLRVVDSILTATAVRVESDVALSTSRSRLDFAGVDLAGRERAIVSEVPSTAVFSVSRIRSPLGNGGLHGVRVLTKSNPL